MKRFYISKAVKRQVLAQQGGKCRDCKVPFGPLDDIEWDHIQEVALGGDSTARNVQGLCIPCHRKKTRSFARSHAKLKRLSGKVREAILVKALRLVSQAGIGTGLLHNPVAIEMREIAQDALKRAGLE